VEFARSLLLPSCTIRALCPWLTKRSLEPAKPSSDQSKIVSYEDETYNGSRKS
jgi:hypothetical protein